MSKIMALSADRSEELCKVGKALSSPVRIQILQLLYYNSYNVKEIASLLDIPASSAALNVRILEEANLIQTKQLPGNHGAMKICSRKNDYLNIRLSGNDPNVNQVSTISMPIGAFTDCKVYPTCGLATETSMIGFEDHPADFYLPDRIKAGILWTSSGYIEYRFPYTLEKSHSPKKMIITLEICSEAPNYQENWKSDITFWINDKECGTWTSPGDFGSRRGKLNPSWWDNGVTQYGYLLQIEINEKETLIDSIQTSSLAISDLHLNAETPIKFRLGNKEDAQFVGGFNLFGSMFGDYEQDILLSFVY